VPTTRRLRAVAMRPRRFLVRAHRWLAIGLLAWVAIMALTGAWLVFNDAIGSWFHSERYRATSGDVGPDAAVEAARRELPEEAEVDSVTLPTNGRGVYQAWAEIELPVEGTYPPTPSCRTSTWWPTSIREPAA
jgi:uncharacterized iron-regulated membrane protein